MSSVIKCLVIALAYFITGRLGLMLPAFGSNITLVWLPTGIAVAAMLRCGFGCWPGVTLGALAVNLAVGTHWPQAMGVALRNTLAPMLSAWMLQQVGFQPNFKRPRDILLLAAAAIIGMLLSSVLGATILYSGGNVPKDVRLQAWLTWWGGDTLGVITTAPLLLTFGMAEIRISLQRRLEFFVWLIATGLTTWAVFVYNRGGPGQALALAFTPLPLVAWAALRFGPVGTSFALIFVSFIAAYGTAMKGGPFYRANAILEMELLWLFMAASSVLGWLVSSLNSSKIQVAGIQRLLERALSDVSLGVLIAGMDRKITYANQGFTRLTGYTEKELLGKSCAILHGPETDRATVQKLKSAMHGDFFFDGEILNYRKDGTTFWSALLISPVHDEDGKMTGFLGIQRDATKRKLAEIALRESRSRLDSILNSMEDVVWSSSPDGQTLNFVSNSVEAMYGLPAADFMANPMKWLAMIHPDDREATERAFHNVATTGEIDVECRIVRADGAVRWVHDRGRLVTDESGKPFRLDGIVTDITERKIAAETLRESENRFRKLIEHAPEAIQLLDVKTGRFIQLNTASERLFRAY